MSYIYNGKEYTACPTCGHVVGDNNVCGMCGFNFVNLTAPLKASQAMMSVNPFGRVNILQVPINDCQHNMQDDFDCPYDPEFQFCVWGVDHDETCPYIHKIENTDKGYIVHCGLDKAKDRWEVFGHMYKVEGIDDRCGHMLND